MHTMLKIMTNPTVTGFLDNYKELVEEEKAFRIHVGDKIVIAKRELQMLIDATPHVEKEVAECNCTAKLSNHKNKIKEAEQNVKKVEKELSDWEQLKYEIVKFFVEQDDEYKTSFDLQRRMNLLKFLGIKRANTDTREDYERKIKEFKLSDFLNEPIEYEEMELKAPIPNEKKEKTITTARKKAEALKKEAKKVVDTELPSE